MSAKTIIESGKAILGIEFGSTRIKAVLIDTDNNPIAQGSFEWENQLVREMQQKLREAGQPWELAKGFDGSAAIGEWVDIQKFRDIQAIHFHLNINGENVQEGCSSDMLYKVDEIISYISQYFTLKTGDLLYTGCPTGCGPVKIDDHLEGYLEDRKVLDFMCK